MILADKITEERKKNGWSQEELANQLGVSRQAVSKWESAGAVPDLQRILQMSELFGVSTDYLLKDEMKAENITILCFKAFFFKMFHMRFTHSICNKQKDGCCNHSKQKNTSKYCCQRF